MTSVCRVLEKGLHEEMYIMYIILYYEDCLASQLANNCHKLAKLASNVMPAVEKKNSVVKFINA